jgi:hypothetical protein
MSNSISRRDFLQTSAALLAATDLFAQTESTPLHHGAIIGHGALKYRIDKLWCKAEREKHPVKDCHEMVQSRDGRLFLITNLKQNNILTFDVDGNVVDAWSVGLSGGHGLTIHVEGNTEYLYLTDTSGRIVKTTLDGKMILELRTQTNVEPTRTEEPCSQRKPRSHPTETSTLLMVHGSQFILRFDRNGVFLGKFGGKSTQPTNPGKFMQAHGVAIDHRGPEPLLVCTERVRNEFNWFTLEGKFVRGVYLPGAYVSRPVIHGKHLYSGVCFGAKPDDYRMWQGRGFVTILDENDKVVSNPRRTGAEVRGGPTQAHASRTRPFSTTATTFASIPNQDLYVCQWNSGNVYPYKLHRIS